MLLALLTEILTEVIGDITGIREENIGIVKVFVLRFLTDLRFLEVLNMI